MFELSETFNSDIDILCQVMENKMLHLNTEFNKVMMEHNENLCAIEEKIVCESGTEDDMISMYMAEAEEIQKKGNGILGKIFAAVAGFFKKIKNILIGNSTEIDEKNLPDEIKVSDNPEDLIKDAEKTEGFLKKFFSGAKGKFIAAAGTAAGTIGGAILTKKVIIPWIKKMGSKSEEISSEIDDMSKKVDDSNLSPEDQAEAKNAINHLRGIGDKMLKFVKSIPTKAKSVVDTIEKGRAQKNKDILKTSEKTVKSTSKEIAKCDSVIAELENKLAIAKKNNGARKGLFSKTDIEKKRKELEKLKLKDELTDDDRKRMRVLTSDINSSDDEVSILEDRLNKVRKQKKELLAKSSKASITVNKAEEKSDKLARKASLKKEKDKTADKIISEENKKKTVAESVENLFEEFANIL